MQCQHYSQDPLAEPRAKHRLLHGLLSDRSRSCAGSNRPSSQLILRTYSQTVQVDHVLRLKLKRSHPSKQ